MPTHVQSAWNMFGSSVLLDMVTFTNMYYSLVILHLYLEVITTESRIGIGDVDIIRDYLLARTTGPALKILLKFARC